MTTVGVVHPLSAECSKTELDLFGLPPTQTAVLSGREIDHHPVASVTDSGPLEFHVSGSGDDYLDLSHTYLQVNACIKRANGAALVDDEKVGPVNLWLHSLFSQLDISLNNTLVSSSTHNYAYRAFMETLLSYGTEAKRAHLTSALWVKDTPGQTERADFTNNRGLAARAARTANSKIVSLMGRVHADLFFQDRYLINNVDLRLRFTRSKANFAILSEEDAVREYKIVIKSAILYCRKAEILPSIRLAHIKALEKGTAKYPIRRVVTKVFTVSQGNTVVNQENLYLGSLPRRLIVGVVSNSAYNGDKTLNPFHFHHWDINFLALYVDGHQLPAKPLQPDFTANYVRSYLSLIQGTGRAHQDGGNDISLEEYANGNTLFAFDLTGDLSDQCHFERIKDGNLRLEMRFGRPTAQTLNIICYAEFDNVIEIDRSRNVIFDYAA
jgi:hypothetical protein